MSMFITNKFLQGQYKIDFELINFESSFYFIPTYAKHRPACAALLNGNYYEPLTHALIELLMLARPGSLIHAGTFYGDMIPSFAGKCPSIVYAFEPVLENYILAKLCVSTNNIQNVALFNAGLGETIGTALVESEDDSGLHKGGLSHIAVSGQPTTLMTIDSLSIDDLSVIQLDVEGYELPALTGARTTIERLRPTILVEDNNGNCAEFLSVMGYILVGKIPGLDVWSHEQDVGSMQSTFQEMNRIIG